MPEVIAKKLREAADKAMMSAFYGTATSTQASPPQEPLTLATINAALDKMPPRETWLSSKLFAQDNATHLRTVREHWTVAHPDFWLQFVAHVAKLPESERKGLLGPFAPQIVNIDHSEGDGDRTKKRKDAERKRYVDALAWSIRKQEIMESVTLNVQSWAGLNLTGA